jgi:hypothetical protein
MTNKSQTVKDVMHEHKKRLEDIAVDAPLNNRARELFEKAKTPLDPQIYRGEFKAYSGKDSDNYESSLESQKRMSEKSENFKDWMGNEKYEAEKKVSPDKKGYKFARDTAGEFSDKFEDIAKSYLMSEGRELYKFLRGQGRDFYDITRIGTAKLENAVAALAIRGTEAALIGASDFDKKISQLASQYGVTKTKATNYVLSHEFVHASQKGKYFDSHVQAELDVEHTLKDYFTKKGENDLAAIASDRASKVTSNYGSFGKYAAPKAGKDYSVPKGDVLKGPGYVGKGASSYSGKSGYAKAA